MGSDCSMRRVKVLILSSYSGAENSLSMWEALAAIPEVLPKMLIQSAPLSPDTRTSELLFITVASKHVNFDISKFSATCSTDLLHSVQGFLQWGGNP